MDESALSSWECTRIHESALASLECTGKHESALPWDNTSLRKSALS